MKTILTSLTILAALAALCGRSFAASPAPSPEPVAIASQPLRAGGQQVISLDGDKWLMDIDPNNTGIANKWFDGPTKEAKPITIPGIIQSVFPDYHGLAWCWLDFEAPVNPDPNGRYLLKFKSVNYKADVWVNGVHLITHEGIESPFEVDVTEAIKPGTTNRLAVRILNVTGTPIDGLSMANTPLGYVLNSWTPGYFYNGGGIIAPVSLEMTPPVYVQDIFAQPNIKTGEVEVKATIMNAGKNGLPVQVACKATPALGGNSVSQRAETIELQPGPNVVAMTLGMENPVPWDVENPFLYNLVVAAQPAGGTARHEAAVRFGMREFRFENGFFTLNGRRIQLRGAAIVTSFPGEYTVVDKKLLRRDVINLKAMGFNAFRNTICMVPEELLDLCDELGVLVYREPVSSCAYIPGIPGGFAENSHWKAPMDDLKRQRWINTWTKTITRDRNHPSVVMWGVVNETPPGPLLDLARASLPHIRKVDPTRIAVLNSGAHAAILTTDGNIADVSSAAVGTGNLSNPGSAEWDTEVSDIHAYRNAPHTSAGIKEIRTMSPKGPLMITESGVGAANNLINTVKKFEQIGRPNGEDAIFARKKLKQFMADWEQWHLKDTWTRPEEFFEDSSRKLAALRRENGNIFRANPNLMAYFKCALSDMGVDGVGMTTHFRDFKSGHLDAMVDVTAPLRWSLFADPAHIYRGTKIRLEALLSNDGILKAGNYPIRLQVFNPLNKLVFEKQVELALKDLNSASSFVTPVFQDDVAIDGPAGTYKFIATLDKGGVPAAEEQLFYVSDKKNMPPVTNTVVLWGDDEPLATWLKSNGISVRPFKPGAPDQRELILVSTKAYGNGSQAEFTGLAERIATGSSVVFLSPEVFRKNNGPVAPPSWSWNNGGAAMTMAAGETISWALNMNGNNGADSTVLSAVITNAENGTTWDATKDLSLAANPNGAWSYRWFDSPSAMGNMTDQSADWCGAGLAAWGNGTVGSMPCVLKNNSGAAFAGWTPGVLGLHPGATGRQPVVTWTAPAAGNYTFSSSFTLVGSGGDGVVPSVSRNLGTDNIGLGSQLIGTTVVPNETLAREPVAPYVGIQFDMFYAPLAKKGFVPTTVNCCAGYYRKDDWAKNHPIFDGLPSGGIMDLHYFRNIVPTDKVMMQMQNPDEAVAGAINACLDYASGLYVGVYKLGAGRFIISNLQILENLGTDPAAERLLRNMLNYLAVDENKPPEQLPAEWNEKLKTIGYE